MNVIKFILPTLFAIVGFFLLAFWFYNSSDSSLPEIIPMLPGMENMKQNSTPAIISIGDFFQSGKGMRSLLASTWPRFRGSKFNNISDEKISLVEKFPNSGPNILWKMDLGEGHSGVAVAYGQVYILDYDENTKSDILKCLSLDTGEIIWERGYKVNVKRNHGFSRTVPAISGKYVVTIGPKCQVMCADALTGNLYWGIDLVSEWDSPVPLWYTGQCPLIYQDRVILAVGSKKALILAVECETGKVCWTIENPKKWEMSHSSIMPLEYQGQQYFVYCSLGGITVFSPDGKVVAELELSKTPWNPQVIAPSPLVLPDGKIWLTAGYGAGSMLIQLIPKDVATEETLSINKLSSEVLQPNLFSEEENEKPICPCMQNKIFHINQNFFNIQVLQTIKVGNGIASEQQTPIFYNDHIFAILPKDAGEYRGQLICCVPFDGTKFIWTSGKTQRFGLGPFLIADKKIFILNDDGTLTIAKATAEGYFPLAKHRIMQGRDAWAPMALVGARLLLRDSETLFCLDVSAQ